MKRFLYRFFITFAIIFAITYTALNFYGKSIQNKLYLEALNINRLNEELQILSDAYTICVGLNLQNPTAINSESCEKLKVEINLKLDEFKEYEDSFLNHIINI